MPISSARAQRFVRRALFDLGLVRDPRASRGKRHSLLGMVRALVVALVCGARTLRQVEELCERLQPALRKRLGLRGTVSDTALYELLCRMDDQGFREVVWDQLRRDLDAKVVKNDLFPVGVLSLDGKGAGGGLGQAPNNACRQSVCDAKGTPAWDLFMVRACLTSSSACPVIDQQAMGSDKGEATLFPEIFDRAVAAFPRLFDIITYDAGATSRANAETVLRRRKQYVFALKGSYGLLFPMARSLLESQPVVAETRDRAQGEEVVRQLRRAVVPAGFDFPGAREIWSVTQTRIADGQEVEREERIFVTSIAERRFDDRQVLALVRMHWRIENGANWTFDVVFGEDSGSPCETGLGNVVVSWLRILAFNLLSAFRARLPLKDKLPRSWAYCTGLAYDAFAYMGNVLTQRPNTTLA